MRRFLAKQHGSKSGSAAIRNCCGSGGLPRLSTERDSGFSTCVLMVMRRFLAHIEETGQHDRVFHSLHMFLMHFFKKY